MDKALISLLILFFSLKVSASDTIPKPIYPTTLSKDKIVSASILLTKPDGSIIIIDDSWRLNIRRDNDKVAIIYPDSSRVIYRLINREAKDTLITIPFTISKKKFDEANNIKLEIIR